MKVLIDAKDYEPLNQYFRKFHDSFYNDLDPKDEHSSKPIDPKKIITCFSPPCSHNDPSCSLGCTLASSYCASNQQKPYHSIHRETPQR